MPITKVFKSGNSQAVRIPKEYRFKTEEVEIIKRKHYIIIRERPKNLAKAFKLISQLPEDFFAEDRKDELPQGRERF